jgi:hypothetical protein
VARPALVAKEDRARKLARFLLSRFNREVQSLKTGRNDAKDVMVCIGFAWTLAESICRRLAVKTATTVATQPGGGA